MAYLLDANVFIEAKNRHYGFDFCPAFWEWLDRANDDGRVSSVESVRTELLAGEDELSAWVRNRTAFFVSPDESTVASLRAIATWANGADYEPAAVSTFLRKADYYLVAQARAAAHVVVTHERFAGSPRQIKIPNACIGSGVRFMSPFEMLRIERARFVLSS